jgi:hypothetical protein
MGIKIKHIIVLWFIMIFSAFGAETSWSGKWHVNWMAGAFILNLEQHGSDVNGTFEPSNGIVNGQIEDSVLHAMTVSKNGAKNKLSLTISDSGESFFGTTGFGGWVTGIRVNSQSKFNAIPVDQSTPMKAFYSFLELGNAVRAGNYEILKKAMNIVYFSQDF